MHSDSFSIPFLNGIWHRIVPCCRVAADLRIDLFSWLELTRSLDGTVGPGTPCWGGVLGLLLIYMKSPCLAIILNIKLPEILLFLSSRFLPYFGR